MGKYSREATMQKDLVVTLFNYLIVGSLESLFLAALLLWGCSVDQQISRFTVIPRYLIQTPTVVPSQLWTAIGSRVNFIGPEREKGDINPQKSKPQPS